MHNIAFFNLDLPIHPVHRCFFGIEIFNDFVLFSPIMSLNLVLLDFLQFYKLGPVFETCKHHFIASQVNDRVREDINNLSKYFFDKFVSLV